MQKCWWDLNVTLNNQDNKELKIRRKKSGSQRIPIAEQATWFCLFYIMFLIVLVPQLIIILIFASWLFIQLHVKLLLLR